MATAHAVSSARDSNVRLEPERATDGCMRGCYNTLVVAVACDATGNAGAATEKR